MHDTIDRLYPQASAPMRQVLQGIARSLQRRRPAWHEGVAAARAAYASASAVLNIAVDARVRQRSLHICARDGFALPARLYEPLEPAPSARMLCPVLLYLHGGGFVVGGLDTHAALCSTLATQSGAAVLALEYRLAPEYPFPCAAHDAVDALHWLHQHAHTLGLDAQRLAVGGDSAGATLAAVCAIAARDAGLPLALQLLIYPGTRPTLDSASQVRLAADLIINAEHIAWFFNHYAPELAQRHDWRFAPLLADLAGTAAACVCLAEYDPMLDDGLEFADALRMAGVPVQLELYRGVTHEFIQMGRVLPQALEAHADMAAALRSAFAHPTLKP